MLLKFYILFCQWRLQDFFVGGAKGGGGLTVQRGDKKLIKLRENNERLTLAIVFFLYTAASKKAYLTFFLWY